MRRARRTGSWLWMGLAGVTLVVASACSDDTAGPSLGASSAAVSASAAAATATHAASASAAVAAPAAPVCERVGERKVWAKWVNTRTGLTATPLGHGAMALGVAVGNRPHALVFDADGKGTFKRLAIAPDSSLAKEVPPAKGVRHLQRVTITAHGHGFADHRDKMKNGRRRIACGPLAGRPLLSFEGAPLLHTDDRGRKAPVVAPSAAVPIPSASPTATAAAGADALAQPVAAAQRISELRDCRTFSNAAGTDVWSVGSELVGRLHADGSRHWLMRFFTLSSAAGSYQHTLHSVPLGKNPKKLHTLEAPVAARLSAGHYVLAGRYRGRLFVWLLGADKKKQGRLKRYTGGYPNMARIVADGSEQVLLTSQLVKPKLWQVRGMRLSRPARLAASLFAAEVGAPDTSQGDPTFARVKEQRWVAYQAGERRKGRVTLVPVDNDLAKVGKPFVVTTAERMVSESYLFATGDALLQLVTIERERADKAPQLVSETLRCSVQ